MTYCDLTTGPGGERVEHAARTAEIERRYGADSLIAVSVRDAHADLVAAVGRAEALLTEHRGAAAQLARNA